MFYIVLYFLRVVSQFFIPIHHAFTSYTALNEDKFDRLLKYFCITSALIAIQNVISLIYWNEVGELLYLLTCIALIVRKYEISEKIFDIILGTVSQTNETKIDNWITQAEDQIESLFKLINEKVILPCKTRVKKMFLKSLEEKLE